jgi:hypothetical protein
VARGDLTDTQWARLEPLRIFTELQAQADAKNVITWDIDIDSTVCRAHRHATGARKRGAYKRSRPAASLSSRTITVSDARAAA